MKEMSVEMLLPWLLPGSSCLDALSRPPGDQMLICQEKSALTRNDQTICSSLHPGRARRRLLQYFSLEMSVVVMHRSNHEKMVEELFTEERRDKVLTVAQSLEAAALTRTAQLYHVYVSRTWGSLKAGSPTTRERENELWV